MRSDLLPRREGGHLDVGIGQQGQANRRDADCDVEGWQTPAHEPHAQTVFVDALGCACRASTSCTCLVRNDLKVCLGFLAPLEALSLLASVSKRVRAEVEPLAWGTLSRLTMEARRGGVSFHSMA